MQNIRTSIFVYCLVLLTTSMAQHPWQEPLPPRSQTELEALLGPEGDSNALIPSKELNIVIVWGDDCCHQQGYHEYEDFKNLWTELLNKVPRVTVTDAFQYPSQEQWEEADLVIFYVHLDFLEDSHYELMDPFLERGGGMLFIHEAVIQRPTGTPLAQRCGLAWNDGVSEWGVLPTPVHIRTGSNHPIVERFADSVDFVDEFYWALEGDTNMLNILGTSQAPAEAEHTAEPPDPATLDGNEWPIFWTLEPSNGKVFGTVLGHNLFTFYEPFFRTILFRALAWALDESFIPFRALTYDGITLNEDMVSANPPGIKKAMDFEMANGQVSIITRGNYDLQVINAKGVTKIHVLGAQERVHDLSSLSSGLYIIKLSGELPGTVKLIYKVE